MPCYPFRESISGVGSECPLLCGGQTDFLDRGFSFCFSFSFCLRLVCRRFFCVGLNGSAVLAFAEA
jgi:hypothetical protein